MKISIQVIVTVFAILLGNVGYSQSDSVYIVKGDSVLAVYATTAVDSIIFYRPNTTPSGGEYVICDGSTFTWNDVTNPITGRTWMDRNLGASQVATSSTDSLAYGDLYQWGRGSDGHQCRNSDTIGTLSSENEPLHQSYIVLNDLDPLQDWRDPQNDNLWQGVDGINNPCPTGYRLPTYTEWEEEVGTWAYQNASGAFGSVLKLPVAGSRGSSIGSLYGVGTGGSYWSSTVSGTFARRLYFNGSYANLYGFRRVSGNSVRCIKD